MKFSVRNRTKAMTNRVQCLFIFLRDQILTSAMTVFLSVCVFMELYLERNMAFE